ncbi:hypothetical protein [Pectinatus frisingensis]|uniref:hypothetical protein n=1 Tax=Pectinatus frisingensis TaxID=865 RepID=UPI0018C606DC|nr:hypothetical protein [Pectinatus frisingensis]
MAKLAKLTRDNGKPVYVAVDKIIKIYGTESYTDGKRTVIDLAESDSVTVIEKLDKAAKTIEEASAPCFVFGDINTEREGEE